MKEDRQKLVEAHRVAVFQAGSATRRDVAAGQSLRILAPATPVSTERVVIAIDLDYFYAQVEVREGQGLDERPVGVTQQHIVVTCNYHARELGVKKLMLTSKARELCPEIVLMCGEDLTKYRAANEIVHQALRRACGSATKIEKLGLDEFFVDATELVHQRLKTRQYEFGFAGIVYPLDGHFDGSLDQHTEQKLMVGSQLAAELRQRILDDSRLTCCAGVSTNKMLAKFAANMNKPDKQTCLLPTAAADYVSQLPLRQLPGVGYKSSHELQSVFEEISTGGDLRAQYNLPQLENLLGVQRARWLWALVCGEDPSAVKNSEACKVVSVEDSFRAARSWWEVKDLIAKLCSELRERLRVDAELHGRRKPTIFRITFRHKKRNRESRSSPFPDKALDLEGLAISLLTRAGLQEPFHLTLLGVGAGSFTAKAVKTAAAAAEDFFRKRGNKTSSITCPVCQKPVSGLSNDLVNAHIDKCLLQSSIP